MSTVTIETKVDTTPSSGERRAGRNLDDGLPEFTPLPWTMSEIKAAVPAHLHIRKTGTSFMYLGRDLAMLVALFMFARNIDPFFQSANVVEKLAPLGANLARWSAWGVYWWFQSLVFTGLFVIGHECAHWSFSDNKAICEVVGFVVHTVLGTPHFSWALSHHVHHRHNASMEKDDVYVPPTRAELGIPEEGERAFDYEDYLGDTPIYALFMLVRQQVLAYPLYLLISVSGLSKFEIFKRFDLISPSRKTNLSKRQRNAAIISNIGVFVVFSAIRFAIKRWGMEVVAKYYGVPWVLVSHWFIMITYLQHTDPLAPKYRNDTWNFARGSAATVDRPFLGWQGTFFLHNISHYHVAHHFFPLMPFYNCPEATKYLQEFLGEHYLYNDKPAFKALWDNFNECKFVDNYGDVIFWKNKQGKAIARPASQYLVSPATTAKA